MESVANLAREQRQPGGCPMRSANAPKPTRTRGGRIPGRDLENRAQADSEIPLETEKAGCRTAVVVGGNGVQCAGEHDSNARAGRFPESSNPARGSRFVLEGKGCFVKRPNESELETTIVARIWITFAPPPCAIKQARRVPC